MSPRSLAPEDRTKVLDALRAGVDRPTAAQYVGLDPYAFARLLERAPTLLVDVEAAEAAAKVASVGAIARAAKSGDWRAASFLLDREPPAPPPSRSCDATSKRTGKPCANRKGFRTKHVGSGNCYLHGGRTPNGIKGAQKEQAEAVVAKLGLPVGTGDPFALLEKAVRYAEGYLEATAQLLVEVVEKTRTDVSLEAAAAIHVRAIRQGATTGNQAVEANVADRQAKIGEQLGKVVVLAVQAALDRAGVGGDMRVLAEAAAAEVLDVKMPVGAELN